ncbi:MAG: SH3 domain-containing protein [Bdellovibrionaceae bacterium]|nr:SH3 domain-containing protein [Pseudobdellovibrionaceae bacterium]
MKWILTSLALGAPQTLFAAPSWVAATSFYRSPEALFPSGQTGKAALEKALVRQEQELFFQVKWNGKESRLAFDEGIIDLFCIRTARLKENTVLLSEPRSDAKNTATLSLGDDVKILERSRNWMKVQHAKGSGWVLWNRIEAKNDDHGLYLPVIETFLRKSPSHQAAVLTTILRGTRLQALSYEPSGWMRVQHGNQTGYVDLQHLAGRADFAAWAWERGKGWFLSSHREGAFLHSVDQRKVPLSDILGFAPTENRLIVSRNETGSPIPLRARAEISNINLTLWGVSRLNDHGEVWWKKDLFMLSAQAPQTETLTTEQLLKREIFSYAIEDKKQIRGLASSQGIWKTDDGRVWRKISIFGDQDLPVAIHPKGTWLVGTYRSSDQGNNFENSIRWDELARTVERKLNQVPKRLTLKKLEILPSSEVEIQLDTGSRSLSLRSRLDESAWY